MQPLSFGKKSLLNGIRRALKVRELAEQDQAQGTCRDHSHILNDMDNTDWESVPVEACFEYVTLLNLRTHQKLTSDKGERHVTEQIYVHTKLMIVDDLYALFGSANINERSLSGVGDSEIAVLVVDQDTERADINGKGSQRPVRTFAHQLRTDIWKKLFGITAGGKHAADHLKSAIEAPGSPASWRSIQAQAQKNAAAYEAVFPFVPKNFTQDNRGRVVPNSIISTWQANSDSSPNDDWRRRGQLASPMPFQSEFWSAPRHNEPLVGRLKEIKGFITALPTEWTRGENVHIKFPATLVTEVDDDKLELPGQRLRTYVGSAEHPLSDDRERSA